MRLWVQVTCDTVEVGYVRDAMVPMAGDVLHLGGLLLRVRSRRIGYKTQPGSQSVYEADRVVLDCERVEGDTP